VTKVLLTRRSSPRSLASNVFRRGASLSVRAPARQPADGACSQLHPQGGSRARQHQPCGIDPLAAHARASHAIDNGGTIEAGSPAELVTVWRAFLATAARGMYVALYRGSILGLEPADEASYTALAA